MKGGFYMAWIILDIAILLFIVFSTFIGYKLGLIKVAFGIVSFILAIIISLLLYKPISNVITNHTPIPEKIETTIESRLVSEDKESTNFIDNYYNNAKNASSKIIAQNITSTVINIGSALVVFLLVRIILLFLRFSTDLIAKLPLIKQCNHIGGFLYGIIAGFLIVYLFFTVISILSPIINLSGFLKVINSSIIGNIMYNNNIIFMFFA